MEKTTFVVGAGASYEFGLPTGEELLKVISNFCNFIKIGNPGAGDRSDISRYIRETAYDYLKNKGIKNRNAHLNGLLGKIQSTIWLSSSIDNFINEQADNDITFICKLLIYGSILFHEKEQVSRFNEEEQVSEEYQNIIGNMNPLYVERSKLSSGPNFLNLRQSWLVQLFKMLRQQVNNKIELDTRLSQTTFIIFNYDRCVEHFLHNAFMQYEGMKTEEVSEKLSQIKFIHPYGTLGQLPWQGTERNESVGFGEIEMFNNKHIVPENIKTFTESVDTNTQEKSRLEIKKSKRVFFLGFGFHNQNLDYLGINSDLSVESNFRRNVYATGYGLTDYTRERIKNKIDLFTRGDPRNTNIKGNINLDDCLCAELLKEYGEL